MRHVSTAQTVGPRTPKPALPTSCPQQTPQRISYPQYLLAQTSQRLKYIENVQQKQSGMFKHQSESTKLLDDGLACSIQSQMTTICINLCSPFVQLSSLR